MTIIYLFKWY